MKNTIPASLAAAISLIQGEHSPDGQAIIFPDERGTWYIADLCWLDELCALMASDVPYERDNAIGIWINSCGPLTGFSEYPSREAAQSADLDRILTEQQAERSNEPNMPVVSVIHAPEWAISPEQQERLINSLEARLMWSAYSDDVGAVEDTLRLTLSAHYGWNIDICLGEALSHPHSGQRMGYLTASIA